MASVTAEVVLYFGDDSEDFVEAINKIRFITEPPLDAAEIIALYTPVWRQGFDQGYADGYEDGTDW